MKIFTALSRWRTARHQKWLLKMELQGKCPACYGNGIHPVIAANLGYFPIDDCECPGCNGTGLFFDWAKDRHQEN